MIISEVFKEWPEGTMANLLKCPEFLRTCLTPKMSETSLRYRV